MLRDLDRWGIEEAAEDVDFARGLVSASYLASVVFAGVGREEAASEAIDAAIGGDQFLRQSGEAPVLDRAAYSWSGSVLYKVDRYEDALEALRRADELYGPEQRDEVQGDMRSKIEEIEGILTRSGGHGNVVILGENEKVMLDWVRKEMGNARYPYVVVQAGDVSQLRYWRVDLSEYLAREEPLVRMETTLEGRAVEMLDVQGFVDAFPVVTVGGIGDRKSGWAAYPSVGGE